MSETNTSNPTALPCKDCHGSGKHMATYMTPPREYACSHCQGKGSFDRPDSAALIAAITTSRGAAEGKRRLLKAFPKKLDHYKGGFAARAYYIWRLARFHGGADVCLPMVADMLNRGDPYLPVLDVIAEHVARGAFGTDMAAAYRWSGSLHSGMLPIPDGLPATAYPGGPEKLG